MDSKTTTGPTPLRSIRLDDETWQRLLEAATAEGTSRSELIRRMVEKNLAAVLTGPEAVHTVLP